MKILITGCRGFIGFNISKYLLDKGFKIIGIDNLNDYYDVKIKIERLREIKKYKNFKFNKLDISNNKQLKKVFVKNKIDVVINLVLLKQEFRYSINNPRKYLLSNTVGFYNVLENSRIKSIKNLIFASSSSVYGDKSKFPIRKLIN